ncbi:hypothetical protein M3Y98_00192800 [Aphelenchoides besseyi]|nr:hypothetical protein M3Y98_00192800 [Aphelenchoides besseyi]KAI6200228.1 hypothetical protein M3Y96_00710600 [Aphelenchoides besseyi]
MPISEVVEVPQSVPSTSYNQDFSDGLTPNNRPIKLLRAERPSGSRVIAADVALAQIAGDIDNNIEFSSRSLRRLTDDIGANSRSAHSGLPSSPHLASSIGRASTGSIIVFTFALSGILLVFLLFYFLAKICSPADDLDSKDPQPVSNRPRQMSPRKLASAVQESPCHVLYPRRIYELKQEEGCYSSLPSMQAPEMTDDVVVLKKSASKGTFRHLVRKLTTSSAPLTDSFGSSPDSPCLSIHSET